MAMTINDRLPARPAAAIASVPRRPTQNRSTRSTTYGRHAHQHEAVVLRRWAVSEPRKSWHTLV